MKPERRKRDSLRASIRKTFRRATKPALTKQNLVRVCDLSKETTSETPQRKKADSPSSLLQTCTPLGTPSCKRPKLDELCPQVPPPLDLTPAAASKETQVVVIDPYVQDDLGNQSDSSSSSLSLTIESVSEPSASSSFLSESSELDVSNGSGLSHDDLPPSPGGGDCVDGPGMGSPVQESVDMEEGGACGFSDDYRIVRLQTSSSYLLLLPRGGTYLPIRGLAKIRSLLGMVSVLGYDISPEAKDPVPVFCPTNVSFLCLETHRQSKRKELKAHEKEQLQERLSVLLVPSVAQEELLMMLKSDSVLLHVSRLAHGPSKFITGFPCHKHLYTGGSAKKTLQKDEISLCHKVGLFMDPSGVQGQNAIQPPPDYKVAAQSILGAVQRSTPAPRVMFVGPKNSGKSTALRYIVNKLQNFSSDVCYLECDPGQTEFTVPAVLSLHVVRQPLLGPPFTHLQEAEQSFFLGDVNPADNVENYMKIVAALYQHYQASLSHLPLFINTMGWVDGLGLRLLREIAALVRPSHMVQLVPQEEQPITLFTRDGDGDRALGCFNIPTALDEPLVPPEQVLTIEAKCQSDSYQASSHRELNILAALGRLLDLHPDTDRMVAIRPRVVPFSHVALHVCHEAVPASRVLYAANASIVGLCTTSSEELQRCGVQECAEGLRTLSSNPVSEFHGIGIIRGIDPEKKLFYILPAVPSEVLPRVNTLLLGSLSIPECVFKQQASHQEVPYVSESFDSQIPGSQPVKPKTYLKRGPGGRSAKT